MLNLSVTLFITEGKARDERADRAASASRRHVSRQTAATPEDGQPEQEE